MTVTPTVRALAGPIVIATVLGWGCLGQPEMLEMDAFPQDVDPASLEIGQPFPPLVLPLLDGTPGAVSDFRGEKLILHVFASW